MNLLEYVQSLGSDISLEEKIALTKGWKKKNEPAETIVEEVKIDPVVETDATAPGKTKPVSNEEFMKSISGGGIFDSLENTTLSQRLNATPGTSKDNPLLDPVESNFDIKDFSNISPDPTEYFIHKDRLTHYFLQQQDIGKVQWQTI